MTDEVRNAISSFVGKLTDEELDELCAHCTEEKANRALAEQRVKWQAVVDAINAYAPVYGIQFYDNEGNVVNLSRTLAFGFMGDLLFGG